MGIGKDFADQLKSLDEQREADREASIQYASATRDNIGKNWEALVSEVDSNILEFAENYKPAQYLRTDRLNDNNLTIHTTVQPIVKVEIIRYGHSYIQAHMVKQNSGFMAGFTESDTPRFPFTPTGFGQDTPEQLAARFCEFVFDFFRKQRVSVTVTVNP